MRTVDPCQHNMHLILNVASWKGSQHLSLRRTHRQRCFQEYASPWPDSSLGHLMSKKEVFSRVFCRIVLTFSPSRVWLLVCQWCNSMLKARVFKTLRSLVRKTKVALRRNWRRSRHHWNYTNRANHHWSFRRPDIHASFPSVDYLYWCREALMESTLA